MDMKFSEDIVPLGDLKANPGKMVKHVNHTERPVLVTSHGRGVAVLEALQCFENKEEERKFMRAVLKGFIETETGKTVDLKTAKARLGID